MRTGLAEAWCSRVCDEAAECEERLLAAGNLAECRLHHGQYAEAERINREVLGVCRRILCEGHPRANMPCLTRSLKLADMLDTTGNLAESLTCQGTFGEAEELFREVLDVQRRVLGEEHPWTLSTTGNLTSSLWRQGKNTGAERIEREVLDTCRRVLGEEHPDTLDAAGSLANSLLGQGRYAEAERIEREVLGAKRRVLGESIRRR
jgi:tetratricopeptide (TPR) repeat protein